MDSEPQLERHEQMVNLASDIEQLLFSCNNRGRGMEALYDMENLQEARRALDGELQIQGNALLRRAYGPLLPDTDNLMALLALAERSESVGSSDVIAARFKERAEACKGTWDIIAKDSVVLEFADKYRKDLAMLMYRLRRTQNMLLRLAAEEQEKSSLILDKGDLLERDEDTSSMLIAIEPGSDPDIQKQAEQEVRQMIVEFRHKQFLLPDQGADFETAVDLPGRRIPGVHEEPTD